MSARASRKAPALRAIEGSGWATGRVELQACQARQPALIATVRCDSLEEARAAGARMLERTDLELVTLRIVLDGDVLRAIDLLTEED